MSKLRLIVNVCAAGILSGLTGLALPAAAQNTQNTEQMEQQLERDLTVQQKPIFQIVQQVLGSFTGNARIDVDAWVDNPNLTYAVGQPLRVMVRPKRDAYITVVDVGSSGRVAVLYPNHFQRDARVRAGSTVMIPGDRAGWEIKVGGPAGVDLIQVIASSKPLTLPELNELVRTTEAAPLMTLGRSADEVARDLVAQLKPQQASNVSGGGMRNLLIRVVGTTGMPAAQPGFNPPINVTLPSPVFGLSVRPDRQVYRVGEPIRIVASSQNDCRLTLISVGASGKALQLFPNPAQPNNLILAGQTVVVPPIQSSLQFVARPPAGVEGILAVCRDQSIASPYQPGPDFLTVGTIQTVGRDLIAQSTDGGKAEQTSTSYIVVE